jgi:hypothetical protein
MIQQNAGMTPAPLAVRNLLAELLGREVTVAPAEPLRVADLPTTVVALYVNDSLTMNAVIGLDLPLAAFCGAALGLLPAGGAEDCIEEKALSPLLAENVTELCNVLTALLNRAGGAHHRLHRVYLPGDELPADAAARLLAIGQRLDLDVDVSRYGSGRFSLSLAG